jgi:4-aminobutyrate aminotransferase-like enzyme
VAHAVLKVIKAGRRLVLISATRHEGRILKIRPPLVFSSKDAKLFLATLDEVLTALWRTPPADLPVQARGRWDQGCLIEPTRSVSAPFAALSTTLSGETLHMASGKEVLIAESDVDCCRRSLLIGNVLDVALVYRRRVAASFGNPR